MCNQRLSVQVIIDNYHFVTEFVTQYMLRNLFFRSSSSVQVHLADHQSNVKPFSPHSSSMTLTASETEDILIYPTNVIKSTPDNMECTDCPPSSSKTFRRYLLMIF